MLLCCGRWCSDACAGGEPLGSQGLVPLGRCRIDDQPLAWFTAVRSPMPAKTLKISSLGYGEPSISCLLCSCVCVELSGRRLGRVPERIEESIRGLTIEGR